MSKSISRAARLGLLSLLVLTALAACGGSKSGSQMQWIEGTAPSGGQTAANPTTAVTTPPPTQAAAPTATTTPAAPSATAANPSATLTAAQMQQDKPDEIGLIPVLEYHLLTTDDSDNEQFVRPISKFKSDLQWLYDHNFYVVTLRDIITNHIAAPAGKHPFALTFDDSTTGQFRFIKAADGSLTVDPNSGVGVMEAFFAAHPDFGHTAFFAIIAQDNFCFDWQGTETDSDQEPYCAQKITWLLDHGYEAGNHTVDHIDMRDIPDDQFLHELGGNFEWMKSKDPRANPDILALPNGDYPDAKTHQQQRTWLRDGFTYQGVDYKIIGCLEVGANPTEPPDSNQYDPVFISRIQAFDADAHVAGGGGFDTWFPLFESSPQTLYTSDGNPNTITVPNQLPIDLDGTLDANKIAAEGKTLIRYDA